MLFETIGLKRSFGKEVAVESADLGLATGEIVALLAKKRGAGERTLLNLISGIIVPDEGSIEFKGEDIISLTPLQRTKKGLVCAFDDAALFEDLTLADHILAVSRNLVPTVNDLYAQWRNDSLYLKKGMRRLAEVGLHVGMDTRVSELFGVQKKLLGLGLATLEPFDMLVWQGPVQGLRERSKEKIKYVMQELRRNNVTILFTSTDVDFIQEVADRMLIIDAGVVSAAYNDI